MWMLVVFPVLGVFLIAGLLLRIFGPLVAVWARDTRNELCSIWNGMIDIWKDEE